MSSNWIIVRCPVCKRKLGEKQKGTLASFICEAEGCSKTKHFFYPNQIVRPAKSIPWYDYHDQKKNCHCPNCEAKNSPLNE